MEPTIAGRRLAPRRPDDARWPRRGVDRRLPRAGRRTLLAIKRVAAGPGERVPFADGYLDLADDEAWLLPTRRRR